jgi:hypothetical protein
MSKPAIFGIVKSESQAQNAIAALEQAGFATSDISVLSSNDNRQGLVDENVDELGDPTTSRGINGIDGKTRDVGHTNATKAPEGTTAGVISGGVIGGVAGWLIGIGALAIPGVGPFIAAGPILAALSGAAIVATAGGIAGALIGYGIPEYEAKLYADRLHQGHILIGVHAIDSKEADTAKKALSSAGAEDIKVTSEVTASK